MAQSWAHVPAYAASLEQILGPGAAAPFLTAIEERSAEMRANGRGLFERFLDHVVAPIDSFSAANRVRHLP